MDRPGARRDEEKEAQQDRLSWPSPFCLQQSMPATGDTSAGGGGGASSPGGAGGSGMGSGSPGASTPRTSGAGDAGGVRTAFSLTADAPDIAPSITWAAKERFNVAST